MQSNLLNRLLVTVEDVLQLAAKLNTRQLLLVQQKESCFNYTRSEKCVREPSHNYGKYNKNSNKLKFNNLLAIQTSKGQCKTFHMTAHHNL